MISAHLTCFWSDEIRIYVTDLAAYNNGILHGVWIDACDDSETIKEQINEMLASSPEKDAEDLADYAEELTTSTSEVPEHLSYYINYERMGRDMEISGDIFTIEAAYNEVHIFSNH